ncbi:MAG: molecular chaperone HtpG [Ignavibacteriaceae bacterium]|nr:molecular chaperone HtpG [Ignavibacteriaceae bacterium]
MSHEPIHAEKFEFKAEVRQLLDILVHSLYSSREIFIRELISNANDALDKVRIHTLTNDEMNGKNLPLEIRISCDKDKNKLIIEDTGIGMTREELINNIGTIAKSGTAEFINQLKESKGDTGNLIGRFGVGFYSVFMAASKVQIITRSVTPGAEAVAWESDGLGEFTVGESDEKIERGTRIEIWLKEDTKQYSEVDTVKSVIKNHSNFINFPVFVEKEKINTLPALWLQSKSSIKKEDYQEFYKFLTYDSNPPLDVIHVSVDAPLQFNALLFIPEKSLDFFGMMKEDMGLDLYVRKVLIQHKNKDLIPEYLGFIKGVVDSEDIPLNISRETLQENANFSRISTSITSQILNHLIKMAKDRPEDFAKFWKEHGKIFKLGYQDFMNREKFAQLLRFNASYSDKEEDLTSLEEYESRMVNNQKEIFFITATSRAALLKNPFLDTFRSKGIPVLFVYDPIDEYVISSMFKYKDFTFKAANSADFDSLNKFDDINPEEKPSVEELSREDKKHLDSILEKWKDSLGDKVKKVILSKRLKESPVVLASEDEGMSSAMLKMMRMSGHDIPVPPKVLEVNKDHKLIREMIAIYKLDKSDALLQRYFDQLYLISMLYEGELNESYQLVEKSFDLMTDAAGWYLKGKDSK